MRLIGLFVAAMVAASAAPVNVALNKPVTLVGVFGNSTAGTPTVWPDFPPGAASTVTDGLFVADQNHWQDGTVWWHEYDTTGLRHIDINLQGLFLITGAIVQADNNDAYLLEYEDTSNTWHTLWNVPVSCCWGMATRPNRADNTEVFPLPPVTAKEVRISGIEAVDRYYAVSEVQVFGTAVPEPASLVLVGAGIGLLGFVTLWRRKRV